MRARMKGLVCIAYYIIILWKIMNETHVLLDSVSWFVHPATRRGRTAAIG